MILPVLPLTSPAAVPAPPQGLPLTPFSASSCPGPIPPSTSCCPSPAPSSSHPLLSPLYTPPLLSPHLHEEGLPRGGKVVQEGRVQRRPQVVRIGHKQVLNALQGCVERRGLSEVERGLGLRGWRQEPTTQPRMSELGQSPCERVRRESEQRGVACAADLIPPLPLFPCCVPFP